jgi:hypothetical protein
MKISYEDLGFLILNFKRIKFSVLMMLTKLQRQRYIDELRILFKFEAVQNYMNLLANQKYSKCWILVN